MVVAIVPFFGGTSSATHSLEETRLDYLRQTLESLEAVGWQPRVFQATRDRVDVKGSTRLNIEPIHLPWAACSETQRLDSFGADLVYVTEADQIVHMRDKGVLKIPDESRYLAPWRLDLVDPSTGEGEVPDAPKYKLGKKQYSISNGAHHVASHRLEVRDRDVLPIHAQQHAFSGAFLATRAYFAGITFRRKLVLPVEHATGFDANAAGTCVKTTEIERFWIDHLSPRDRFTPKP